MSYDAVRWAREQRLGDPVAKNVLVALAEHHNGKTRQCNPKVATICLETDFSERAVRKALTKLKQAGLIRVEGGGKAGNSYQLLGDFNRHAVPDNEAPELNLTGTSAGLTGTSCTPKPARGAPPYRELELEPERTRGGPRKRELAPARGTRIPENFSPDISIALAEGMTTEGARRSALNFIDYWKNKPGAGGRKLDWEATWRIWARKDAADANRKGTDRRQHTAHIAEQALEAARQAHEREQQGGHSDDGVEPARSPARYISRGDRH
ncbi:helix-turn-helix domain-containing protein [Rhizobium leguminosarum]|uniref:helix-turn-helix domain-containing protein n=1 Tax=Rhizobium ruizarguesonis TaxID=2081791 RepID=UPI0013DEE83C|nr:helix-turn-helix domain-containing protein [Rhizobium ruizarguesonis]MBY5849719.1 helix-turn-helix domain-containing protein [Rhizobium leguminosarum]NEJ86397.1 helix-turn-helix domain-containing protein [Rhizobium ruizarguesonis]